MKSKEEMMIQSRKWLILGLSLALFGGRALADDLSKGKDAKEGASMPCCVDKKDCCKDMKPCCSMKEGQWGKDGNKDKGNWKDHKEGGWKDDKGGGEGRGPMGKMAEKLGLSEDQKAKLKALHEKQGEAWKILG